MLNLSSQRRPASGGTGNAEGLCFPSCIPCPVVQFPHLLVAWWYLEVQTWLVDLFVSHIKQLLISSNSATLPIAMSIFGPGPPVFVYTQGTVPNRRTTAFPELITDMARVLKVEPNTYFLSHQVRLFVFKWGSKRSPFFPGTCPYPSAAGSTLSRRRPESLDSTSRAPKWGKHVQAPHNAEIVS